MNKAKLLERQQRVWAQQRDSAESKKAVAFLQHETRSVMQQVVDDHPLQADGTVSDALAALVTTVEVLLRAVEVAGMQCLRTAARDIEIKARLDGNPVHFSNVDEAPQVRA